MSIQKLRVVYKIQEKNDAIFTITYYAWMNSSVNIAKLTAIYRQSPILSLVTKKLF